MSTQPDTDMTEAAALLDAALCHVDSESIRGAWATQNRATLVLMAQAAIHNAEARGGHVDPMRFGTYLLCLAMGL